MNSDLLPCVYILAKASHSTLYTGVTSNLPGRVWQHREGVVRGFTRNYCIKRLVWFERHETMSPRSCARSASSVDRGLGNATSSASAIRPGATLRKTSDFLPCR
jgi:hypothetical protein